MLRTHKVECTTAVPDAHGFADITEEVRSALRSSGIANGQVTVFSSHLACSIVVNERESGLLSDIRRAAERIREERGGRSAAPRSTSVVLPVVRGQLRLGTWQRVLVVNYEDAADHPIVVHIMGE